MAKFLRILGAASAALALLSAFPVFASADSAWYRGQPTVVTHSGVAQAATSSNPTTATIPTASVCTQYPTSHPTLREGARDGQNGLVTSVHRLQCLLNLSLDPAFHTPLEVDGIFGPKTKTAVVTFQHCAGLPVDGIVGPQTWSALETIAPSPNYVC